MGEADLELSTILTKNRDIVTSAEAPMERREGNLLQFSISNGVLWRILT
jgi:hypothetical protein